MKWIRRMKNRNEVDTLMALRLNDELYKVSKELGKGLTQAVPDYFLLEKAALDIKSLLSNARIENKEFETWKSIVLMDMDIFIDDLVGNIRHDYEERLKKYKGKWIIEKSKLDKVMDEFRVKLCQSHY